MTLVIIFVVLLIVLGIFLVALGATKDATEKNRFEAKWETGRVQAQNELIEKKVYQDQMLITDRLTKNAATQGRALKTDQSLIFEKSLSEIRLSEFGEKEAIKLNNEFKQMSEQVRLALVAKALSSHQRVVLVQELLDGLYKQIEEVEHSSLKPETRQRMIEDREAIISNFKGYRDAEGSRLLQAD